MCFFAAEYFRQMHGYIRLFMILLVSSGCVHSRSATDAVATIEFERREDNGSVNIVPCTLSLSDDQKVTLSGGEKRVVFVSAGSFYLTAASIDPYAPHSEAAAWNSRRMRFRVRKGEHLRLLFAPTSTCSTYVGGWTIQVNNKTR
jgi:hypothetical protein